MLCVLLSLAGEDHPESITKQVRRESAKHYIDTVATYKHLKDGTAWLMNSGHDCTTLVSNLSEYLDDEQRRTRVESRSWL